jgi:hypothetical protein
MNSKSFLQQAVNYAEGRGDAAVGYEEWVALEQRKGLETVTESQCSAEWLTFWRKVL